MQSPRSYVAALGLILSIHTFCSGAIYSVIDLGTLGGSTSVGLAINNSGQVTGWARTTGDTHPHAFLYHGTMHDLSGGALSPGHGINDSDYVTGWAFFDPPGNTQHAFLYDGTMHDLERFKRIEAEAQLTI